MKNKQFPLVALVGRPNVGKSSIFNRIARKRKAIVDNTPGVTRDRHYELVTWMERSFILIDTGGIEAELPEIRGAEKDRVRKDRNKVTRGIQEQTWQAVEEADIIVFILDGKAGLNSDDYDVAKLLRRSSKPVYFMVNKIDGPEVEDKLIPQFYELGVDHLWPVSAAHGYGLETFLDALVDSFPDQDADGAAHTPDDTINVAFIGRPNVGKSSLVNKLLGETRMVVSDVPGTTRDSVDTLLEKKGRHYLLIDTAGIRRKGKVSEKLEKFSVMQALSAMERCDIALVLVDAEEGIAEQDTKVIGYGLERGRACLVLINKWDMIKDDKKRQKWVLDEVERSTNFIGYAPTLNISALTGFGINKIYSIINKVYTQFALTFTTNRINRVLQKAIESHTPPLHKGRRLKFYYTTQVASKPPTFVVFVNYPKGVHFSYYRYLVNQFRKELGLDKCPVRLFLRERKRKKYV